MRFGTKRHLGVGGFDRGDGKLVTALNSKFGQAKVTIYPRNSEGSFAPAEVSVVLECTVGDVEYVRKAECCRTSGQESVVALRARVTMLQRGLVDAALRPLRE